MDAQEWETGQEQQLQGQTKIRSFIDRAANSGMVMRSGFCCVPVQCVEYVAEIE
ncbi:hypothetical protein [Herbaspirillum autotrophicum]|uniref:hypothetical protein n=1 Tax=Herbaspirillum autotrophicum TaxID=180195 RepID=UPI0012ED17B1|nr:hypothetical protein [Herbaspirillum autotrophicum]